MSGEVFDNAGMPGTSTYLTNPCDENAGVIDVHDISSAKLQTGPFRAMMFDPVAGATEYVMVTQSNTQAWHIQRGIEGSTPKKFGYGSIIKHVVTAAVMEALTNNSANDSGPGLNVKTEFGAKLDGVTNDDDAWEEAVITAQATDQMLFFPSGSSLVGRPLPIFQTCGGIIGAGRGASKFIIDPTSVRSRYDGNTDGFWSPTPPACSAAIASGSGLAVGTYRYRIAFQWQTTGGFGTTTYPTTYAGDPVTITTTSGNQKVNLSNIPTGPDPFVTRRLIYRSAVGGAFGSELLVGTIENNTATTYTDTTPDAGLDANNPVPICTTYHGPMLIDPCSSNPGLNAAYPGHTFRDFSIHGDTDLWGRGGVQARMWQIDGIRCGSNDTLSNLNVQGLNAGYTIQGDHNNLYNCWGQINAKGLRHIAPNPADLGNNTFIGCKFDNAALASVTVAPGSTTQGDFYAETHFGWSPYSFYKEGVGTGAHANQPLGEMFIDTCVFSMCFFEAIGNGVMYDPSAQAVISNNIFEGLQGAGWFFITSGAPDVRNGNIYCIQNQPADWNFYCGVLAQNRIFGGGAGFGPGNKGCFYAKRFFFDFYHDEARLAIDFINLNNAVLAGGPGAANNQVYAAAGSAGQLLDVRIRYNATEAHILPCTTPMDAGDVGFHIGVDASPGVSRSSGGHKDQPVAGIALCASGSGQPQPGIPIVKDGFVSKANLIAGLTLASTSSVGGWLKPSGNDDGLIDVAANQADYSIGYWIGGQTGQVAGLFVSLNGGGALLTAPPFLDVGDGSDGAFTLDGIAIPAWATFSGGYYRINRDVQCTDLIANSGVLIQTNGNRILISGNYTDHGATWVGVGGPANGSSGGGPGISGAWGGFGGGGGGAPNAAAPNIIDTLGSVGGAGAIGAAGTATPPISTNGGSSPSPLQMSSSTIIYHGGTGGGGGATGGGGGGGGVVYIAAKNIVSMGLYQAFGGDGFGGGGGGGGGLLYIAYNTKAASATPIAVSLNGGAGSGAGAPGTKGRFILQQASLLSGLDTRYAKGKWRVLARSLAAVGTGGSVTAGSTVYFFDMVTPNAVGVGVANGAIAAMYIDPADRSSTGSLKLRIRGLVVPNAVAPGCDYLFQMASLNAGNFGGPSGQFPQISSTAGSFITVTVTAAQVAAAVGGAAFPPHTDGTVTITTAGWYVFIIRLSATPAAGALSHAQIEVDYAI